MKTHIPNPWNDALLCGTRSSAAQWTVDDLCKRCLQSLARVYEEYKALHPDSELKFDQGDI